MTEKQFRRLSKTARNAPELPVLDENTTAYVHPLAKIKLVIPGNFESLRGNPIPYVRMTQRSKFVSRQARRYLMWKKYVQAAALTQARPKFLNHLVDGAKKTWVDCMIYFADGRHGDPDNIRKGILDALFEDDRHVAGNVDFDYDAESPRVEVVIWRPENKA